MGYRIRLVVALAAAITVLTAPLVRADPPPWAHAKPRPTTTTAATTTTTTIPATTTTTGATTTTQLGNVSAELVPRDGAWWGDYVSSNPADVPTREALVGRSFDIFKQYQDANDSFPDAAETILMNGGRFGFFVWEPERVYGNDPANVCWSQIATGARDADIDRVSTNLKASGIKMLFGVGNEPDTKLGACNAPAHVFGSAADYVNAYRHVVDRMRANGVTNAVYVLALSGWDNTQNAALYPGDGYVDWLSQDPYNWYGCRGFPKTWQELTAALDSFYSWANGAHPTKPQMLAEYGSQEPQVYPGDTHSKGQWFRNAAVDLKLRGNLKAVVYFDQVDTDCQWKVDSSVDSLGGFTAMGQDPYFRQPHS